MADTPAWLRCKNSNKRMSAPNCSDCDRCVHVDGSQPGNDFCPNTQSTTRAIGQGFSTFRPMLHSIRARTTTIRGVSGRKNLDALSRCLIDLNAPEVHERARPANFIPLGIADTHTICT